MRLFFQTVASGYVLLGVNILFVFAQVPLALHYLPRDQFGLWALILQLTGYLQFIDVGMSASVSRHLVDYKDEKDGGVYGSLIQTAAIVLLVQGAIVLLAGTFFSLFASDLLHIQADLASKFRILMILQCAVLAIGLPGRIFYHILTAHQRLDILNYCLIGLFLVNYAVLWFCFAHGSGVFSLFYAGLANSLLLVCCNWAACLILKLFPSSNAWGRPNSHRFRELFAFGKDVFWVTLGAQMINASQTVVITRTLGLDASGVWAVGTRGFTMVTQLVWRPFGSSYPVLSEMIVRGERERLLQRFKSLLVLSCSVAAIAGIMFALCNKPFVELWTNGKVTWNSQYDLLLGVWLIVLTLVQCHCGLVIILKEIGSMKYIYFIEGAAFLAFGSYFASRYGIAGLLTTSIFASLLFTCSYGIWRTAQQFNLGLKEVALRWVLPSMRLLFLLGTSAFCLYIVAYNFPSKSQLAIYIVGVGVLAPFLFARYGLTTELRQEILARTPTRLARFLAVVFSNNRGSDFKNSSCGP